MQERERLRTNIVTLLGTRAIVVLGSKGEGKSSAVNSAWSAMAQELETPAPAGDGADSFTNDAHCYSIDVPAHLVSRSPSKILCPYWDTPGSMFEVRYLCTPHLCSLHVHRLTWQLLSICNSSLG